MDTRRFNIWVEGDRDSRLIDAVAGPLMSPLKLKILDYRQQNKTTTNKALRAARRLGNSYFFMADQDRAPCAGSRKSKLIEKYPDLDEGSIIVVSREIESWYIAGIDSELAGRLGIRNLPSLTDDCVKSDFEALRPTRFDSEVDFMIEVARGFNIETARRKNRSFDYLIHRIGDLRGRLARFTST
jgi:hypothetical protein